MPQWVRDAYGDIDFGKTYLADAFKRSWPCPIYCTVRSSTKAHFGMYACPRCGELYYRKKTVLRHMGFIMNIPETCSIPAQYI